VIGVGPPREVLTEEVLERTYGAGMEVLQHGGMTVVVDPYGGRHGASRHPHVSRVAR
jgi:hypothetical protein